MKQYIELSVEIYAFDVNSDVITLSVGTSNDNNYSDIENWD
jgi:hypothetical protein